MTPPDFISERFQRAIARFDEENARDPAGEEHEGLFVPRELLYARRLNDWIVRLDPSASESLRLAGRCQHIRRWEIPRNAYPLTRAGYHEWRTTLKHHHATVAAAILAECGYDQGTIQKVRELNLKSNFPADPDSRTMEDALCLMFLQFQFSDLAAKTEEKKVVNALQKSWNKMTANARVQALQLPYTDLQKSLLAKVL